MPSSASQLMTLPQYPTIKFSSTDQFPAVPTSTYHTPAWLLFRAHLQSLIVLVGGIGGWFATAAAWYALMRMRVTRLSRLSFTSLTLPARHSAQWRHPAGLRHLRLRQTTCCSRFGASISDVSGTCAVVPMQAWCGADAQATAIRRWLAVNVDCRRRANARRHSLPATGSMLEPVA
jgi:hypothetical protein